MAEAERSALLREARAALRTIFLDFLHSDFPEGRMAFCEENRRPLAETLDRVLTLAVRELEKHTPENEAAWLCGVNALVALTPGQPLTAALEDAFFELAADRELDLRDWLKSRGPGREQLEFYRNNLLRVLDGVAILKAMLPEDSPHLNPAVRGCLGAGSVLSEAPENIVRVAELRDPFQASRSFRYGEGEFFPVRLEGVRTPAEFCGYQGVRSRFREQLGDFAAGKSNVPLLVSSLPGLGKTQFSIAYTLEHPELTLIFAEPEALSGGLARLIALLKRRKHRRFAVFFDDIEPEKIDWYGFRTNVGGSAMLPENILFILATNGRFPVNILSRGREVTFPVFDETRCMEMVEDFLAAFGLKKVNENLTAVIASSYIEDYGQKKFTELSPRTLMRYLEHYRSDGALRRKILALSQQEMIVRPDAQVFYEFNIRSLRALYGDSYIDRLREEQLKALEG